MEKYPNGWPTNMQAALYHNRQRRRQRQAAAATVDPLMDLPVEFTLDSGRKMSVRPNDVIIIVESGGGKTKLHVRSAKHHDFKVREDYDEVKRILGWS